MGEVNVRPISVQAVTVGAEGDGGAADGVTAARQAGVRSKLQASSGNIKRLCCLRGVLITALPKVLQTHRLG